MHMELRRHNDVLSSETYVIGMCLRQGLRDVAMVAMGRLSPTLNDQSLTLTL